MLKKLVLVVAVVFAILTANGQAAFEKGDLGLNIGADIGGGVALMPGLNASLEYGLFPIKGGDIGVISLGGFVGGKFYSSHFYPAFAARGAFHLGFLNTEKFDVYAGVATGFGSSTLYFSEFVGGRYMFKEKFGVFAEVGYGYSSLKGGLTWIL